MNEEGEGHSVQGEKPQQSIVKETKRIAVGTVIMLVVMLAVYAVLGKFTVGVLLGGLLGSAPLMPVHDAAAADFIARGGRIPAPLQSLKN